MVLQRVLGECRRELQIVKRQLEQYQGDQLSNYAERRKRALESYESQYGGRPPLETINEPMEWEDVID